MSPEPAWLDRLASVIGPPRAVRSLGGAYLIETGAGAFVAKTGRGARDEANGLQRIGAVAGAPPVPEVVVAEEELLVTRAVPQAPRRPGHDVALGLALAGLHGAALPHWGGGSPWIGRCAVDPAECGHAASFYGARLTSLAVRCGLGADVEPVVARLAELIPPGPPALVHGDLWWGNVLFGTDGRSWLIDPSVHGGHPEEDLAMLGLFGPVPPRLRDAYAEVRPLTEGWEGRIALFQLYPLLVHAVLFGGGYREQARSAARRYW